MRVPSPSQKTNLRVRYLKWCVAGGLHYQVSVDQSQPTVAAAAKLAGVWRRLERAWLLRSNFLSELEGSPVVQAWVG